MDMKFPFSRLGLAATIVVFVMGLSACDNIFQVGLGEEVDIEAPRIQITGRTAVDRSVASDYLNTDILVTGTATDDQGVESVTVSWDDKSVQATVSGSDWSAIIPIDDVASDGALTISAIATDAADKSSPAATTSVQVDRNSPTVLISAPQTYNAGPTNSDYIVIQGEAWDPSPLTSVFVEVINPADSSVVVRQKAEGDRSWFTRILLADGFDDNSGAGREYRYRVLVTDAAGNVNSYQYHSSEFWDVLPPGALFPSMVEIGQWDQEDSAITAIDAAGETALTASRISTAAASTTLDFIFNSNKDIPQISLSNLDESAPLNENAIGERVPIFASAIDDKEGINTSTVHLEITFLDDPVTPQQTLTVPGSNFSSPGDGLYTSFEFALSDAAVLSPGRYGGRITLADQKGTPAELPFEFLVDRGVPQIVSIAPSSNLVGTDANGDVTLQVRIQDDNPGATLTGTAADSADSSALTLAVVSSGTSTSDQDGGTVYLEDFEVTVSLPDPAPNTLHVDLEVRDASGLINSRSLFLTIDQEPPILVVDTPTPGASIGGDAMNVAGTSSDDTLRVYLSFQEDANPPPADLALWEIAEGNVTWSYQHDLSGASEGNFTVYAQSRDVAGNFSTVESVAFSYDFAAPTLTEDAIGSSTTVRRTALFSMAGTSSDSNGVAGIVVEQTRDGGTPVVISGAPATSDGYATWTLTDLPRDSVDSTTPVALDGTGDGSYEYQITATDVAGKSSVTVIRNIVLDTVAPSVEITRVTPIVGADTVNGTISFSASVTDSNGLDGVEWAILPAGSATPAYGDAANASFAGAPYTADIDTTELTDLDDYDLWVVSQDRAGNETAESFLISVDQSSDLPWFDLSNIDATVTTRAAAPTNLLEFNAEIIGTAFDDDSVVASQILVQIDVDGDDAYSSVYDLNGDGSTTDPYEDETQWWPVSSPPGTDGTQVSFRQDLTFLPEGVHKLRLQIQDVYGTTIVSPDIYFVIDKSAPKFAGVTPANGSGKNGDFFITGTISDTAGLLDTNADGASIPDIEWGTDGVAYTAIDTNATGPATSATFSIPITVADYGDGTQSFYLRATDIYGKTNVVQLQVLIDTSPPTVSYLYPSSGASINGLATVRGTSSDANQVFDVQYSLDGGTTWTSVTGDRYSWNFSFDTRSGADGGTPGLTQGPFTLNVRAIDSAGNISAMTGLPLELDQTSDFPVITLINLDDTVTASGSASDNLLESNAKVQGTVTDDDWVDVSTLRISIDNGPWESLSIVGSSATSVSFEHPLSSLADGEHSIAFQVSDTNDGANNRKGGLPAVQTQTSVADNTAVWFALDKSNPVVVIAPPASTYTTGVFSMSGTVSDGNDVNQVLVSTDEGLNYTSTGVTFTPGAGTPSIGWSWSGDLSGKPEGPFRLKVKGIDEFNKESITDLVITVDQTGPLMAISTPSANATVNGPVNLSGTGSETYGFALVEVGLDADLDGNLGGADDLGWVAATGTYAWSYALDSTSLPDGTYDLYVRGTDEAGNVSASSAVRRFVIDQASDRPSIELATISVGGTAVENLLPGSLQISGTASDDDSVESTSIQIRIDVDGDGSFDSGGQENWASITGQPSIDSNVATWSHTFSGLSDGIYTFQMRVGDINYAGDYADEFKAFTLGDPTPVNFSIDSALPTGTITAPAQGAFLTDPGLATITVSGTASDASGIASVQLSFDGGPLVDAAGTTSWSYDYALGGDGQVSYQVIITDNYGKIFTIDRYFTVDTTAPVPSFTEPAAGATVNGSLLVRGTTDEANQVASVYIWTGPDNDPPPNDPASGDFTGWTPLGGTFNWSHRIDTTDPVFPDDVYDVHVRAVDNAGNVSAATILQNLVFDQSTNLPVISFSNLNAAPELNLFGTGGTITGSVSDDDTVDATSIQISFDGGGSWADVTNQGSNGGNVSFSHDLSGVAESGTAYQVQVRASDVGGANAGDEVQTTTTGTYEVAVDRTAPTVDVTELAYDDPYGGPISITGDAISGSLINNGFVLTSSAGDPSGIKTMEVSVNGAAYTTTGVTDNGDGTWSYDVEIDVAAHGDDGTFSLSVRATDAWDRVSTTSLSVIIDTRLPTVSFLQPGAGANVNGTVTVRGTSFDASALTDISIVGGGGGTGSTVDLGNTGTIESWETTFDATAYESGTYADDNGDGTWAFPIVVAVEDAAGNVRTLTRTVNLDPEGDKPVIVTDSLQPADGASVAGTIVMTSSVTDDDGAAFVRIYADLDDNGLYDGNYPVDLDGDGLFDSPFENEANFLEVAVSNGSWTTLVNENSEFGRTALESRDTPVVDATGYVRFRFVPYDVNGLAGDPVERRIYIDDSAPEILGLNYSNAELVRGSVTLTGTIRDDADLTANRMKISFDGGTTYQNITITSGPTDHGDGYRTYTFSETINTTVDFPDASGNLGIAIQVTDETFKTSTVSLTLNVDNKRPGVLFNDPETLPFIGTQPNEIYSFYGNNSTADAQNQLFGSATDTGVVSGIQKINVYFVKNGNFESPKTGVAAAPVTTTQLYNQAGTQVEIPFTEDPNYVITIDNRIEQGQFDQEPGIGDFDGFQESLRAKVGYDEWYAFFDTTVLPDGPLQVYFVAYDEAGNTSYGIADAQVANNPPTIDSVEITAESQLYSGLFKRSGSLYLQVNASDVEGIDQTSYVATITEKVVAPNGVETTDGPPIGTTYDIASTADGSAANEITIDISEAAFVSGVQYTFTIEVRDTDGNIATTDLDVWVDNQDSTDPTVSIDAFDQSNVAGFPGHIEAAGDSPDADNQADLSGTVRVTGTAGDDTAVDLLEISFDGGTNWTTIPAGNRTETSTDVILGTDYAWYYDWDTSTIGGAAAPNVNLVVRASDTATPANTGTDSVVVDIVPYITGVTGTGFDSGLLTFVRRSATGAYPIRSGATITISGYNLPGTAAGSVDIGGATYTPVSGNSASIDLDMAGVTTSGDLTVVTNGVSSINNTNSNLLSHNQEPDAYNPSLTDDRGLVLWQVSQVAGTSTVQDATMHPNAAGNDFDWMYVKNGKQLWLLPGGGAESLLTQGTGLSGGDFTYNADGTLMFLFNHNAQWSFSDESYRYTGSVQWGAIPNLAAYATYITAGNNFEAYNWNQNRGIPRLGLGNVSFGNQGATLPGDLNYGYANLDLNRYRNLKLLTSGGDAVTRNYVAYFDSGADESRSIAFYGFRTGTTRASVQTTNDLFYIAETAANKLNPWVPLASSENLPTNSTDWYANIDKHFQVAENYAVSLTGNQDNNENGIATPRGRQDVTTPQDGDDSADFDLAVYERTTTSHYGFIAYFDESLDGRSLKITANESLYEADPTGTLGTWTVPATVDANGGADVAIAVDPNGGIHLAYQSSSGYLKYAYLTYNDAANTFTVVNNVFVDALFGAGSNNAIIVRDFGTDDYRPVIATFSSAFTGTIAAVRMSYPLSAPAAVGHGASESTGQFTGAWETVAMPATTNPEGKPLHLFTTAAGEPHLGYDASTLEEATFLGF